MNLQQRPDGAGEQGFRRPHGRRMLALVAFVGLLGTSLTALEFVAARHTTWEPLRDGVSIWVGAPATLAAGWMMLGLWRLLGRAWVGGGSSRG